MYGFGGWSDMVVMIVLCSYESLLKIEHESKWNMHDIYPTFHKLFKGFNQHT